MSAIQQAVSEQLAAPIKLDIGCGKNKAPGFFGVDAIDFEGVDIVCDVTEGLPEVDGVMVGVPIHDRWMLRRVPDEVRPRLESAELPHGTRWWLPAESVDEIHTSHFVEHLTREQWVPFFNEAYRVLKWGATMRVIVPHFSHACAYGDPTHKSFCSEWMANYFHKGWRDGNAPHTGYTCDFDWTIAGSWDPWLNTRHDETRMFAMTRYLNSYRDLIINLVKTKR